MYKDKENIVKVKVIGVGGGGNNAAMRIINDGVQNIETYLLNISIYSPSSKSPCLNNLSIHIKRSDKDLSNKIIS